MINFEEELKNFQPLLEIDEVEDAVQGHELSDMIDLLGVGDKEPAARKAGESES